MLPEIVEMFPDAPLVSRNGQINAWDDPNFRRAIEATGRKKLVVGGITTDVCVTFATLSMLEAGYDVYVVVDASGTTNPLVQQAALMRMSEAGAEMDNWFAFACEMLSDWRNAEGAGSAALFADHMPGYAEAMASHAAFTGSTHVGESSQPAHSCPQKTPIQRSEFFLVGGSKRCVPT